MFDRRWLGDEFESLPGLFADFDANGRLRRFGRRDELCQVEVVVHPPQATTREVPDDDLLPEEWLDGWRHNLLEQARPKEFKPACSFCGKTQAEVRKLIAGPQVMICNECVDLCAEILAEES